MKKRILVFLLLIILIFTGCSKLGNEENVAQNTGEEPIVGGVLNLSSYSPDTMNPLVTQYSCVRDFLYLVYEGLFIVNEDLTVSGVLASDYSVSEGNTVYTIKLKNKVTFHDGSAFNADDVIATFEYIQTHDGIYKDNLANVKSYTAKDNSTVVITLYSPQANFVNNLDFPILPSKLSESDFKVPSESFKPNGTGRYAYAKTLPYEAIELTANENWHGKTKIYIPTVSIRFVSDNDGMLYAFDSRETDIITTERARWGEFPYTGTYRTGEITTSKYTYIGFNTSNSAFSDIELRKAVYDLIDREELVSRVLFSHAVVADCPISPKAYFASSDEKTDKKDTSDAIELLKKKKLSLYLLYNEESAQKKNVAEYVAKKLKEAGVEVVLTHVDYDSYVERIKTGDYNMYIGEVHISNDADVSFMFDASPEPVMLPEDSENTDDVIPITEVIDETESTKKGFCSFSSVELDGLIYNLNTATTAENAAIAYKNFKEYFNANAVQLPLFFTNEAIFVNSRIKGKIKTNLTNFYADFGELYIETVK